MSDHVDHNHFTRDIKQPGVCPACDLYHHKIIPGRCRFCNKELANGNTACWQWECIPDVMTRLTRAVDDAYELLEELALPAKIVSQSEVDRKRENLLTSLAPLSHRRRRGIITGA